MIFLMKKCSNHWLIKFRVSRICRSLVAAAVDIAVVLMRKSCVVVR